MIFHNEIEISCSHCHTNEKVNTYQSINVGINPELKDKVKDGSLFIWECPKCGQRNLAKYQTIYHDPANKLMIWFLPKDTELPKEQLLKIEQELSDYTLRRTYDIGSLIEKVNIFDAGLDDVAIEMCKYVTKLELAEKSKNQYNIEKILSIKFKFYKLNGADNEILMSFPEDNNMKILNIGLNVYEDCRQILRRNPNISPDKGFCIIDSDWLSTKMR